MSKRNKQQVVVTEEVTTQHVMRAIFNEFGLLTSKKITPARAQASARLAMSALGYAELEVTHHKMRPGRGPVVRPVTLVRSEIKQLPSK